MYVLCIKLEKEDPFTKHALNGKNIFEITEFEPRMVFHCFELFNKILRNLHKTLLPSNVYPTSCFNAYDVASFPSCLIVAELGNFEIDQSCRSWKPVTLQFHHPGKRPALTVLTMFPYCEDEKTDKRYSSLIIQRRATFNCLEDEIILSFKFPAWAGYSTGIKKHSYLVKECE